jgi:hypothetical protein
MILVEMNFKIGSLPPAQNVTGNIALIAAAGNDCSWADKILAAELSGAVGAIVYQNPGEPLRDMTGAKYPQIPSTMISYTAGIAMQSALLDGLYDITVSFNNERTSGFWFAIDSNNQLQEFGYVMYPSMVFVNYIQQFLTFQQNLFSQVQQQQAAGAINVVLFDEVSFILINVLQSECMN